MSAQLATVTIGSTVSLVYGAQGSQVAQIQLTNLSASVTIWIGSTPNVAAGSFALGVPLAPGASLTMNGTVSVYAVCGAGSSAQLAVIPEGVAFSPGSQVAPILQVTSQVLPVSGSTVILPYTDVTGYASYDMNMIVTDAAQATAGHALACKVSLSWYDDLVTGIPVFTETWYPWVLTVYTPTDYVIASGPMHGRYMTVTIVNPSANGPLTLNSFNLFGSPRVTALSDWRQYPATNVNDAVLTTGSLNGAGNGFDNILGQTSGLVSVTPQTYLMPLRLYAGPVTVMVQGQSGLAATLGLYDIGGNYTTDLSGSVTNTGGIIEGFTPSGTGEVQTFTGIFLPRAVCAFILGVTTAGTININVTAQQGP